LLSSLFSVFSSSRISLSICLTRLVNCLSYLESVSLPTCKLSPPCYFSGMCWYKNFSVTKRIKTFRSQKAYKGVKCNQLSASNMPDNMNKQWKSWLMGKRLLDGTQYLVKVLKAPSGKYYVQIRIGDKRIHLNLFMDQLLRCSKEIRMDLGV